VCNAILTIDTRVVSNLNALVINSVTLQVERICTHNRSIAETRLYAVEIRTSTAIEHFCVDSLGSSILEECIACARIEVE
jgi:hypothetical protein